MINDLRHREPERTAGRPALDRPLFLGTGVLSLLFAVVAAVWLIAPGTNPFADSRPGFNPGQSMVNQLGGPVFTAAILLGAGLLGVAVATLLLRRGRSGPPPAPVIIFGLGLAAVIGFGLLSESAIMTAGYLMALVVVVGAVTLAVQLIRKYRVGRWVAIGVAAVIVLIFVTGVLPAQALLVLADRLSGLTGQVGVITLVLGLAAMALLWLLVAARVAQQHRLLDRPGRWVRRHRTVITILAALGPLPYCLVRLTWLTPWPYGMDPATLPADIRIWGLLLSSGGWAGLVLTIGLIRPWGEIFPRWVPFLAGRRVPIWFAAAPGSFIAAVLCVSAIPMIRSFAEGGIEGGLISMVIFPFWFWGPMLSLAVWGYVLHRRSAAVAVS
ncbi:hypothetical protein [Microlunatus speluncae]|uniref:hypothetical protein n=1 Tax=Microlunatus speluncae TaxID=2594267 RepID=UPI0012661A69|nr:hypothetical protein [Microlunatus speluncae]